MTRDWNRKLDELTHKILEQNDSTSQAVNRLRKQCSKLHDQVVRSGTCLPLLKLWGLSRNIDDNTGTEIVASPILEMLGTLTNFPLQPPVLHAGIQHTYGYLFSLIETPYGRKRDRWVQSYLEKSLGLKRPTFSPVVSDGTLLLNLTYFLGRVHFRGRPAEISCLRRNRRFVDSELLKFNFRRLKCHRITEELGKGPDKIRIIIDLLPLPNSQLPNPSNTENLDGLLIYGIEERPSKRLSLITTFPVSEETIEELLDQPCGRRVQVQLKYNAFANNIPREPTLGMRTIQRL